MTRIEMSEIHERPWFPRDLRDYVTEALQFILSFGNIYQPIAPRLAHAVRAARACRLVDLCSGAGGPWLWLHRNLRTGNDEPFDICLSDKYPNILAFERLQRASRGRIRYCSERVDAERVPQELSGFRTIFTGFHHFSSIQAAAVLQDAFDKRQGIGVFEISRRKPISVFLALLMPLAALALTPFMRPFRWPRLFWTYLVPVIPFVLWFDGMLSSLRAYSRAELSQLISKLMTPDYTWEVGEEKGWLSPITYLVGYPQPCQNIVSTPSPEAAVESSGRLAYDGALR